MTDFSESYARGLLSGIADYAHDIGQAWSLCRMPLSVRDTDGIEAVVAYAVQMQADAVIGQFYATDDVSLFAKHGIIAIAQDFKSRFSTIMNITGEHYASGKMGAEYFIKKGFANFAFYGASNVEWSDERYHGYRDTILETSPDYTISSMRLPQLNLWDYDYQRLSSWLKMLPKPVALFACDDNQAYFISEVCRRIMVEEGDEKVRIPEDIAILGVDNDETICKLSSPNLSSIGQDVVRGGYETAMAIDHLLKDPSTERKDVVVGLTGITTRASTDVFVNSDPVIARVLRIIHERAAQKISVDDIVAQAPMSRRLLELRFRKAMGTSVYDYVLRVRIDKVAQLLRAGKTVSEAAYEYGFNEIKNLSRAFKRMKGITPTEYRRRKLRK